MRKSSKFIVVAGAARRARRPVRRFRQRRRLHKGVGHVDKGDVQSLLGCNDAASGREGRHGQVHCQRGEHR